MKTDNNTKEENTFERDYSEMINFQSDNDKSVRVNLEWESSGDVFEKFSIYDSSYKPVKTLGQTTLVCSL